MHPPTQRLRRVGPQNFTGGMAEWSNAAVLKTVEGHTSGGSNPSSSAKKSFTICEAFLFPKNKPSLLEIYFGNKNWLLKGAFLCIGIPFGMHERNE